MSLRLNQLLTKLIDSYGLSKPASTGSDHNDNRVMANLLASRGVLVIMCEVPESFEHEQDQLINDWATLYANLYYWIARALFPSYQAMRANYADKFDPPVILIEGAAAPVINVIARYIVPYVVERQQTAGVYEMEVRGLMTMALDELEGDDLQNSVYRDLCNKGTEIIYQLLQLPLQQVGLTTYQRELYRKLQAVQPPPPSSLPEVDEQPTVRNNGKRRRLAEQPTVPVFFQPVRSGDSSAS